MRRSIKIAAVLTLVAVFIAAAAPQLAIIPVTLAFGWIKSAARFASAPQFPQATIILFLLMVVLLLLGTHAFCAWVRRAKARAASPWRWRWTCSLYGAFALVLLASAALVGIVHQSAWMISSPEPVFKTRGAWVKERMRLRNVGNQVFELAQTNKWDLEHVKLGLTQPGFISQWDDFAFYFVAASNDAAERVILLPRNPRYQTEIGIVERASFHTRSFEELSLLLPQPR